MQSIHDFLVANPWAGPLLWPLFTGLFTLFFHWADTKNVPVLAQIVRALKIVGADGGWLWKALTKTDPPTTAAQRGFARLRLLGALAVAGLLGLLVFAPRATVGTVSTASGQGCAFWKQEQPKVVQNLSVDGSCVLSAVMQGMSDPALIAAKCAPATVAQVIQTLSDLATFYLDQALSIDGGTVGAAAPPFAGIPASLDEVSLAKLVHARDQAVSEGTK